MLCFLKTKLKQCLQNARIKAWLIANVKKVTNGSKTAFLCYLMPIVSLKNICQFNCYDCYGAENMGENVGENMGENMRENMA